MEAFQPAHGVFPAATSVFTGAALKPYYSIKAGIASIFKEFFYF
jgi:hypothetical protein